MGNPALTALSFVIGTLLHLYALVVAVRFVMQSVGASGYGPIAQFVITATDPLLAPFRKIMPRFRNYDLAALLLCFLVVLLKAVVFKMLQQGDYVSTYPFMLSHMGFPGLVTFSVLYVLNLFFNIFIFSIVILALLSWIAPDPNNPVVGILNSLASPVLSRVRRFVPPMGGLDLSALVSIIGLYALKIIVIGTLYSILF